MILKQALLQGSGFWGLSQQNENIHGAAQNFSEFQYTLQTTGATNLRLQVPLALSFNR